MENRDRAASVSESELSSQLTSLKGHLRAFSNMINTTNKCHVCSTLKWKAISAEIRLKRCALSGAFHAMQVNFSQDCFNSYVELEQPIREELEMQISEAQILKSYIAKMDGGMASFWQSQFGMDFRNVRSVGIPVKQEDPRVNISAATVTAVTISTTNESDETPSPGKVTELDKVPREKVVTETLETSSSAEVPDLEETTEREYIEVCPSTSAFEEAPLESNTAEGPHDGAATRINAGIRGKAARQQSKSTLDSLELFGVPEKGYKTPLEGTPRATPRDAPTCGDTNAVEEKRCENTQEKQLRENSTAIDAAEVWAETSGVAHVSRGGIRSGQDLYAERQRLLARIQQRESSIQNLRVSPKPIRRMAKEEITQAVTPPKDDVEHLMRLHLSGQAEATVLEKPAASQVEINRRRLKEKMGAALARRLPLPGSALVPNACRPGGTPFHNLAK